MPLSLKHELEHFIPATMLRLGLSRSFVVGERRSITTFSAARRAEEALASSNSEHDYSAGNVFEPFHSVRSTADDALYVSTPLHVDYFGTRASSLF